MFTVYFDQLHQKSENTFEGIGDFLIECLIFNFPIRNLSKNRILNDFLHSNHEIGAITNIVLKFNFWLEIHIELNTLGSLKSVAHVKEQSE